MARAAKRKAKQRVIEDEHDDLAVTQHINPVDDPPRPIPAHFKNSDRRKQLALQVLATGKSVTAAANAVGVNRVTLYEWRNKDLSRRTMLSGEVDPDHQRPDFADQWDAAVEAGVDQLEDECHRRAHQGVLRPVYQGGECVGHVREFSDALMTISLKARRPDRYKDRQELSGPGNAPLVPSAVEVTFVNAKPGVKS